MRTWELPAPIWRPPFLNHTFPRLPAGLWGRATPLALALSAPERGASAGLVPTSLLLRGGRGLAARILPSSPRCQALARTEGRVRVPVWARLGQEEGRKLRGWEPSRGVGQLRGAGFGLILRQWSVVAAFGGLGGGRGKG